MTKQRREVLRGITAITAGTTLFAGVSGATNAGDPAPSIDAPSGASTDGQWSAPGGNGGRNRRYAGEPSIDPDSLEVAWRIQPEDDFQNQVAVGEGKIFLTEKGKVRAFDAESGETVWKTDDLDSWDRESWTALKGNIGPMVDSGTVYIGGNQLAALDVSDGSIEWQIERETRDVIVANGLVYAIHVDDDPDEDPRNPRPVYAYDTDGNEQWTVLPVDASADDSREKYRVANQIVLSGEKLYIEASDPTTPWPETGTGIVAVDGQTGEVTWKAPLTWSYYITGIISSVKSVAVSTDTYADVYTRGDAETFDADTGESLTAHPGGSDSGYSPVAIDNQYVYLDKTDYGDASLLVVDTETDETVWESDVGATRHGLRFTSPIITDDTVIATTESGLIALEKENGDEKWTFEDERLEDATLAGISDETIYLTTDDEVIAVRSPSDNGTDNGDDNGSERGSDSEGGDGDEDGSDTGDENSDEAGGENGSDGDDKNNGENDGENNNNGSETDGTEGGSDDSPGFGTITGLVGAVGGAAVAVRRRLQSRGETAED